MKRFISILLVIMIVASFFTACNSRLSDFDILSLKEQPAVSYEEDAKIYPSQVGSYLTDQKVDSPVITAFMEMYNKKATTLTKIAYDAIRYNAASGYYYVNDTKTNRGIKFALDSAATTIVSAAVYSGDFNSASGNLVDMMSIVASNLNYKNSMSSSDVSAINGVLSTYSSNQGKVQQALPMFANGMQLTMNLDNLFVEIALPDMPLSYTSDMTDVAINEANLWVTSPHLDIPEQEEYVFTLGDDFKNQYSDSLNDNLSNFGSSVQKAEEYRAKATELETKAAEQEKQAEELEKQASQLNKNNAKQKKKAEELEKEAASLRKEAKALQNEADNLKKQADSALSSVTAPELTTQANSGKNGSGNSGSTATISSGTTTSKKYTISYNASIDRGKLGYTQGTPNVTWLSSTSGSAPSITANQGSATTNTTFYFELPSGYTVKDVKVDGNSVGSSALLKSGGSYKYMFSTEVINGNKTHFISVTTTKTSG